MDVDYDPAEHTCKTNLPLKIGSNYYTSYVHVKVKYIRSWIVP